MSEDKKKLNVIALRGFMLKGNKVAVGEVVAKADFPTKGDWQNLCHMTPAKAEETDEKVGKPKKTAKAADLPG